MENFEFNEGLQSALQKNEKMVALLNEQQYSQLQSEQNNLERYKERILAVTSKPENLIGIATGIGAYGMYPVVRIQQKDLLSSAFLQLWNISSQVRYRSGGQFSAPMAVVVEYDSPLRIESMVLQIPGIEVFAPSTELDFSRILEEIPRLADPVLIFVPKQWPMMEDTLKVKWEEKAIGLRQAKVLREGDTLSLVSYGLATYKAWEAAKVLVNENKNIELIDLRCLSTIDKTTILESVKKTGRLVILQDSPKSFSIGAEIAAWASEQAMEYLLAPIQRIAAFDTPDPETMNFVVEPDKENILYSIRNLNDF